MWCGAGHRREISPLWNDYARKAEVLSREILRESSPLRVRVLSCEILSDSPPPAPFDLPREDLDLFALLAVALFGDSVTSAVQVNSVKPAMPAMSKDSARGEQHILYNLEKLTDMSPRCLLRGEAAFELDSDQSSIPWRCQVRRAALRLGQQALISRQYTAKLTYNHSFVLQFDQAEEIRKLVYYAGLFGVDLVECGALKEIHRGDKKVDLMLI